jgi:hypothetical protein
MNSLSGYILKLLVLGLLVVSLAGCALYGSEAQFRDGDHYWLSGSREMTRIAQDKLALDKLKQSPVNADPVKGYRGLAMNEHKYNKRTIKIYGPERRTYRLSPGEVVYDNLISGNYVCVVEENGSQITRPTPMPVGVQQHFVYGEKVHWFCTK